MYKSAMFIGFLSLLEPVWCQKELVWAPILDQQVQQYQQACLYDPSRASDCAKFNELNHPDFPLGQDNPTSITKINTAIRTAYSKGVRVIDVLYDLKVADAPALVATSVDLKCYAQRGENWVKAVEDFNTSPNVVGSQYIKLRLRVESNLNVAAALGGFTVKRAVSEYGGGSDPIIPDLSDSDMRNRIQQNLNRTISSAKALLTSGRTIIESVALIVDAGGESSLFGFAPNPAPADFCNRISFTDNRYPAVTDVVNSINRRARYYQIRERDYKLMLTQSASTIHALDPSIKAAVFFQGWNVGDGAIRGSFDLYGLLKGTGIQVLHHTIYPVFPYMPGYPTVTLEEHAEAVAYSASIARALGIEFDTEFSWPHYHMDAKGNESLDWPGPNPPDITTLPWWNAYSFYDQAVAAFGYGASGFTYANWPMTVFSYTATKPYIPGSSVLVTYPDWWSIIGGDIRTIDPINDSHLYGSDGLLVSPQTDPFHDATKAIYISSLGRFGCEERQTVSDPSLGATTCGTLSDKVYWNWFTSFGLEGTMTLSQVDIITDAMIADNKVTWSKYSEIYIPFEVSQLAESRVLARIDALPSSTKNLIKVQTGHNSSNFQTYSYWTGTMTKAVNTLPVPTAIYGLLLN